MMIFLFFHLTWPILLFTALLQTLSSKLLDRYFIFCAFLHTHTAILWPFVQFYLGGPVPEETFTHSLMKSSSVLYQPPPSAMIHSILPAQTTCFTVSLHNFYLSPLRSTSWSRTRHYILHTFLHPIIVFFSQHMPISLQSYIEYQDKVMYF